MTAASTAHDKAAPPGPLCRVRLLVAYDGSPFHGFALQPGQPTVAGRLGAALARLAGHEVSLTCAGRTDAGVHARGQVVHTDVAEGLLDAHQEPGRLVRSLTRQVGPEVAVLDAQRAISGFDARRSALSRRYRYLLLRTPWPDPLLRSFSWHVPGELDLAAMRLGADTLLGEHDFAAFCRRPPNEGSTVRCVKETRLSIEGDGRLLAFEIEANAFCHQMVRAIVGALVAVGKGRMTPADLLARLRSKDRSGGQSLAPPFGLILEQVRYPPDQVEGGIWSPPRWGSVA
ncbi:MAG: tRNA pseudouridine(38-40) synthase TruA [Actinomycetota bacterium]|nr:tRNA pseudouridine(38-40) synthase TruA [Actinomycetota bacterium]